MTTPLPGAGRVSLHAESGAGTVLGLAVVSAILVALLLAVPLCSVLVARARATSAADAAALAAADVAVGIAPGVPCSTAASVARANRAVVTECQADGVIVTVRVSIAVLGFPVAATATAGPPPTGK
ncbi:secretion/DNA translocation related TadE-like protein [Cryobacterium mesophilum]|uniref:Helicase/secretion neighborhood TadE-like protein n=1 Tax=Terrimesophilobacter mesophilus TaxID=433647 RepID=A0A4R8VBR6_9MICO|nr:Rv3654c family TadE-like protein [Terrimesophilobacter mesophilus]MBB5633550.1 secretion/DNA translocation related TadE-like protein [Terrimesophilobacter mesophilus]TFB80253.1 hypothetical protein E3N84_09560 [Terrimesophilobacter mesophilus]